MVSSLRRGDGAGAGGAFAWVRAHPLYYPYTVLALWALVPGLRRIVDWKTSFNSISVVSILPLLALLPAAYVFFTSARGAKLPRPALIAAWLWCGAFAYAYALGIVLGNGAAATYSLLTFVLPMFFGLYLATMNFSMVELYERFAKFALALSVPIAGYAIYQFIAPPPWDLYWIQQSALLSVGKAAPLAFRPFGTLNGPGVFGDFMFGVVALNLPRLRRGGFGINSAIAIDVTALAISLDRSDWIALVIAVLVFVALSPRKLQNLSLVAVIGLVIVVFAANAATLLGSTEAADNIQNRFGSLVALQTDSSYLDRQRYFGDRLNLAVAQPTGEGLGVIGVAAKLGASASVSDFDNGYIARFTEMGYFGFAAYLATLGAMLVFVIRRRQTFERTGDRASSAIAASVLGIQAGLVFLDLSGDHHSQLSGLIFWLSFGIVFAGGGANETSQRGK